MKRMILILGLFGMVLNSAFSQYISYPEYLDTLVCKDTVYKSSAIFDGVKWDKGGKSFMLTVDFSNVVAVGNDATFNLGNLAFNGTKTAPFSDDRLPYTIVAADSTLQPFGSHENIQQFWIDVYPCREFSIILDGGTTGDTLLIPISLQQIKR